MRSNIKYIRPEIEAIGACLVSIILISVSTYMVYVKAKTSLIQEIKIGLESNVSSAATTINGDVHRKFSSNTARDDSLYLSQISPLEEIRIASKDIRYIYTNILQDGRVLFVLNPSPQNDNDGDGQPDLAPALMDEYHNPAPELLSALTEQKTVVSEIYEDEWGVFISSYAPFYDAKGAFVGTLGMDLELNNFYKRLSPVDIAFEKTVVIILFIGLMTGLLIWYIRRNAYFLQKTNAQLHKDDEELNKILIEDNRKNIRLFNLLQDNLGSQVVHFDAQWFQDFHQMLLRIIQFKKSEYLLGNRAIYDLNLNKLLSQFIEGLKSKEIEVTVMMKKWPEPLLFSGPPETLCKSLVDQLACLLLDSVEIKELHVTCQMAYERVEDCGFVLTMAVPTSYSVQSQIISVTESETPYPHQLKLFTAINTLKSYNCFVTSYVKDQLAGFEVSFQLVKKAAEA